MYLINLALTDKQYQFINSLFENEPNFQPQSPEDVELIEILKTIKEKAKKVDTIDV